mmetsp:Transcript_153687/g.491445  ORF Transcript_153687/g.491445 Transcript_153687/m.491445 type:complete len:365 (+) Transcript_153687:464-1558(+)
MQGCGPGLDGETADGPPEGARAEERRPKIDSRRALGHFQGAQRGCKVCVEVGGKREVLGQKANLPRRDTSGRSTCTQMRPLRAAGKSDLPTLAVGQDPPAARRHWHVSDPRTRLDFAPEASGQAHAWASQVPPPLRDRTVAPSVEQPIRDQRVALQQPLRGPAVRETKPTVRFAGPPHLRRGRLAALEGPQHRRAREVHVARDGDVHGARTVRTLRLGVRHVSFFSATDPLNVATLSRDCNSVCLLAIACQAAVAWQVPRLPGQIFEFLCEAPKRPATIEGHQAATFVLIPGLAAPLNASVCDEGLVAAGEDAGRPMPEHAGRGLRRPRAAAEQRPQRPAANAAAAAECGAQRVAKCGDVASDG